MATITNPWLNPLQRTYTQIKTRLLNSLTKITDSNGNQLITDTSEGNIFNVIISLFSGIAEVLHYYIDNISRESFMSTCRRFESLTKHAALVDYHPKAAIAATVDVIVTRPLNSVAISSSIIFNKGMAFTDNSGNTWLVSKTMVMAPNTTSIRVPLIQHDYYRFTELIGLVLPSTNSGNLSISLPSISGGELYESGTMVLYIDSEYWVLVDTFAYSKPTDRHFMVEVDSSQNALIVFGDGIFGKRPEPSSKITEAYCYITKGEVGNVGDGSITSLPSDISSILIGGECNNPYPAGGGSNYETFQQIRNHIPLSVKTLGVAITKQDFIDLATMVDGVRQASAEYECGKKLNIYIAPENGTVASHELCDKVYNHLSQHAPLTTWLNVKTAGMVNIMLSIDITGMKSYAASEIQAQVLNALINKYSPDNVKIGGDVRISDIYALIDNLPTVDYLNITAFYLKPWPTTLYGNRALIIGNYSISQAKGVSTYIISFGSDSSYDIYSKKGGFHSQGEVGKSIEFNDSINGFIFTIGIINNNYKAGFRYSITLTEPNHDYEDPGYNLPVIVSSDQVTLNIKEVL